MFIETYLIRFVGGWRLASFTVYFCIFLRTIVFHRWNIHRSAKIRAPAFVFQWSDHSDRMAKLAQHSHCLCTPIVRWSNLHWQRCSALANGTVQPYSDDSSLHGTKLRFHCGTHSECTREGCVRVAAQDVDGQYMDHVCMRRSNDHWADSKCGLKK